MQLSYPRRVRQVAGDAFYPVLVTLLKFSDVTNKLSAIKRSNCLHVHFAHLKLKYFVKVEKKKPCCLYKGDLANERQKFLI